MFASPSLLPPNTAKHSYCLNPAPRPALIRSQSLRSSLTRFSSIISLPLGLSLLFSRPKQLIPIQPHFDTINSSHPPSPFHRILVVANPYRRAKSRNCWSTAACCRRASFSVVRQLARPVVASIDFDLVVAFTSRLDFNFDFNSEFLALISSHMTISRSGHMTLQILSSPSLTSFFDPTRVSLATDRD